PNPCHSARPDDLPSPAKPTRHANARRATPTYLSASFLPISPLRIARVFETPFRLAANRLPLSCSAGVRFLPRLKAGVSSEVFDNPPANSSQLDLEKRPSHNSEIG